VTAPADNSPRFRVGSDHVESWFVRANDPVAPRAIWVKATVLTRADGTSLSQAWFSVFDGERTAAFCQDVALDRATVADGSGGLTAAVGPLTLDLASDTGSSAGQLVGDRGRVRWELRFERLPTVLGEPMSLLPTKRLVDAPLPQNKLLTPFPAAEFVGTVTWNDHTWDLQGWVGMQGHNWGPSHSPEYAWGQCVFTEPATNRPYAVVEAASGRVALGRRLSPLFSMLVVRREEQEYRFDRIVDLWRQRPELDFPRWSLRMRGPAGVARMDVRSTTASMVCLAYRNPARATSYCLNSKTAGVRLRLVPRKGSPFELRSEHGGALEFLGPDPVDNIQPVG
jgi:hypothetical protein